MSKMIDKLRGPVLDACVRYDRLRDTGARGLARWVAMYFESEDELIAGKEQKRSIAAKMAADPVFRQGYERRQAEEEAAQKREQARVQYMRDARNRSRENKNKEFEVRGQTIERLRVQLHDTLKILGKRIGDVWYSELADMRKDGAYAASLADQLLQHGIPDKPIRMRDFVSEAVLGKMHRKALQSIQVIAKAVAQDIERGA